MSLEDIDVKISTERSPQNSHGIVAVESNKDAWIFKRILKKKGLIFAHKEGTKNAKGQKYHT